MASPSTITATAFEGYPTHYPLQLPPRGQIFEFDNRDTRGPAIVILCSIFLAIMWLVFILRLYSKVWVIRRFGWDDGKRRIFLAWLLLT